MRRRWGRRARPTRRRPSPAGRSRRSARAVETDTAQILVPVAGKAIGQAAETDARWPWPGGCRGRSAWRLSSTGASGRRDRRRASLVPAGAPCEWIRIWRDRARPQLRERLGRPCSARQVVERGAALARRSKKWDMGLKLINAAGTEPITLAQLKAQCRVDTTDDDAVLTPGNPGGAREGGELHRHGDHQPVWDQTPMPSPTPRSSC